MTALRAISRNLAAAFLAGAWSVRGLIYRGSQAGGRGGRWLRRLARRVLTAWPGPERADQDALAEFIDNDLGFHNALARQSVGLHRVYWVTPSMEAGAWGVPTLATPAALASWLQVDLRQLDWFADVRGWEALASVENLRHYRYHWMPKRSGKCRLLEAPKPRLKAIQRRLLHEILDRIPPHDAAHAYRRGRSIRTYCTPHCGQAIVLRFDLCDFFPSVPASRVHALFRRLGYPIEVARLLTGLCSNVVSIDILESCPDAATRQRYRSPHLPQGAPTSPAVANLCCHRLDRRLAGLAASVGARYTRYADDLAFSGGADLQRAARRFQVQVCSIALEEGFEVNTRKSRFMRQGVRQQLAGIVLNQRLNLQRSEYDRLKAILTNCIRNGPASQNRDSRPQFQAHLAGRIAYAASLNPARAERLRRLFQRVNWDVAGSTSEDNGG
jgi:hypothetical protein